MGGEAAAEHLTPGRSAADPTSGDRGDGLRTDSPRPLRLSPSAVAALRDCPLRWFLDRRVGAGNPSGGAAVVGLVVHAVAEAIARGDVAPDEREIGPFVDEIWASVPFPAHYQRVNERRRVDEMITALLAWDASTGRSVAATELTFNVPVPGTSRPVNVSGLHRPGGPLRGWADPRRRLQDRADRGIRVGDRGAPPVGHLPARDPTRAPSKLPGHPASPRGGRAPHRPWAIPGRPGASDRGGRRPDYRRWPAPTASLAGPTRRPLRQSLGQAELVHLADRFASGMPKVRFQAPLDDGWTWVNDLIVDAARLADGPDYPARPNGQCKSCAFRFMCPAQTAAPMGQPAALGTADASV